MTTEYEYYRVYRANNGNFPLLIQDVKCPNYISKRFLIENPELMIYRFREPIPRKIVMADYLPFEGAVISKKIFDVLEYLAIEGLQLLPSKIIGANDQEFVDYWTLHFYNRIECVDRNLSDCVFNFSYLGKVKKIVLNKDILSKIPLHKRLVFKLKEDSAYKLFHVSIVEKIMAVNPTGVVFTNIEKWNSDSYMTE